MASEDTCSEKQWSVCKALATFVAHRELSKVGGHTWLPVTMGLDQGGEAGVWQGIIAPRGRPIPHCHRAPGALPLSFPHLSLCFSHGESSGLTILFHALQ